MSLKTLILVGSSSHNSHTLHLAQTIADKLTAIDIHSTVIDLVEYQLPVYDLAVEKDYQENNPKVKEFLDLTKEADGYIWGTPVYHGSYSGILKNALDWQHSSLDHKTVGLISNGNNRGSMAVDHLTLVARSQSAHSIPTRVCTHRTDYDENKQVAAPDILQRIDKFAAEFKFYLEKFTA